MNLIELLSKEKTNIIIAPRGQRRSLFEMTKNSDFLYDIKFISFNDLIDDLLGIYLKKALIPIKDKYSTTFSGAESYLEYFLLTNDQEKEFINDYYIYDSNNINYYKDKNIIISLNSNYDNLINKSINILKENKIEIKYLTLDKKENKNHYVIESSNMILEVETLARNIIKLIKNGVDINNIHIQLSSDSYINLIDDIFPFYNIEYSNNSMVKLIDLESSIKLLNYYNDTNIDINLDTFKEYTKDHNIENNLKIKIEKILSENINFDIEYFRYELEDNCIHNEEYKNVVKIDNFIDSVTSDNDYYFYIGANESLFPKSIQISGLLKEDVIKKNNLLTLKELSDIKEEYYINKINSIKNLTISYKLKDEEKEYIKASLIDRLDDIKKYEIDSLDLYSKDRSYLKYLKSKDLYNKYGSSNDVFNIYYNTFKNIEDDTYKNQFEINDIDLFRKYTKNKIKLSYTSIDSYIECPFKYFLNYILKLNKFDSTYATFLGNFFHEYIKNTIDEEYDDLKAQFILEKYINGKDNDYRLTDSDKFYLNIFLSRLKEIHDLIKEKYDSLVNKESLKEEKITSIDKYHNFDIIFDAKPDLLIHDNDENVIVIDYKTGNAPSFNLEKGQGLQLFIYFYIYKKEVNNKANLFGVFYEKIDKTGFENNPLKVSGKFLNDENLISNYGAQSLIGKSKGAISKEEVDEYLNKTSEIINNVKDKIVSMRFEINPLEDSVCKYCNFKDICNKSEGLDEIEEETDCESINETE